MKILARIKFRLCVVLLSLGAGIPLGMIRGADRPNVLLIIADDLGFSDLGCYGGEIETPHLDSLAANGVRFTQFYNTARCWPTRSALLTGFYAQQIRRDALPDLPRGVQTGGRGVRPDWAPLLPAYLKPLGYRCYHSGKWHLDGMPIANGFDRSYYLRDQGRFFSPTRHFKDDKPLPAVPRNSGYYGTNAIAEHAIQCLQEHESKHADAPFFHYLAYTAPHFPLHALPEDIEKYRAVYRPGWGVIRDQRWQRMRDSGLLSGELSAVERDLGPPYDFPEHLKLLGDAEVNRPLPWKRLNQPQKEFQATKMAIHAAMIDRMDVTIGEVLAQIRAMGRLDDTIVFFLSDNGSSAEIMVRSDGHDPDAPPGSAASYLCLGPGWSTTGNTPFRRHKTWTHEGGISTPLIVSWPDGMEDRGTFRQQVGHVIDLAPTILELAGGSMSRDPQGNSMMPPPPGKSLLAALKSNAPVSREFLWWYHDGHKAVRVGDWKAVAPKDEPWELYNLASDRDESQNLAGRLSDKTSELVSLWNSKADEFRKTATADLPISQ